MKKAILFLTLILTTVIITAQGTIRYNLIMDKTLPMFHLKGTGGYINFNDDVSITQSSNKLTISGGDLDLGLNDLSADYITSGRISAASSTSGVALSVNTGRRNASNIIEVKENSVTKFVVDTAGGIVMSGTNALSLTGSATVWDDIMFPFTTGHVGNATYPPFNADSLYFSFTVDSAGNDAQFMYFIIQFPHTWKTGSDIHPHIHYKQSAPSGATPVYIMKYKWYDLAGTTRKGWKWKKLSVPSDTIRYTHQLLESVTPITPPAEVDQVSSIMVCKVYLYSLAAGTTASNSWQFDIHIEKDGLGSRAETVK